MKRVVLNVELELVGPVMSRSATPSTPGVDAVFATDRGGNPMLPDTLVRGRLREAWTELESHATGTFRIEEWLGPDRGQGAISDQRGRLHFTDLVGPPGDSTRLRYRIKRDDLSHAAVEQALEMIEERYRTGESVVFRGEMSFLSPACEDAVAVESIARRIEVGLRWTGFAGSDVNIGFGRIRSATVRVANVELVPVPARPRRDDKAPVRLGLVLEPTRPFCLARLQVRENIFVGESVISGGAIKGAVAEQWAQLLGAPSGTKAVQLRDDERAELGLHFDRIQFSHSHPAPRSCAKRPLAIPLSWALAGGRPFDFAGLPERGCEPVGIVAFAPDWKQKDRRVFCEMFGHDDGPATELRLRNAIDPNTRRTAENQLYGVEAIVPDGHHWLGHVDLSRVPAEARGAVAAQLRSLLAIGLFPIGGKARTHARARLLPCEEVPPFVESRLEPDGDRWVVTLQSPALLGWPDPLWPERRPALAAPTDYAGVWNEISAGTLELASFYATQRLAGGEVQHRRHGRGRPYNPWPLTEAGSVFILKRKASSSGDPGKHLASWLAIGLPLPKWVAEAFGFDAARPFWQQCPYIPENGFGEIAVNARPNPGNCQ